MKSTVSTPLNYLADRLGQLRQDQAFRELWPRVQRGTRVVDSDGQTLVNFGANDYLGLASLPLPQEFDALVRGAGASPLVCGHTPLHHRLCRELALWEQTEAAVLFPCGYSACCGVVATLAEAGDLILSDQLNHASLIDGCRLSRAERMVYEHCSVAAVRDHLEKCRSLYARVWIVTEGVFGMDGDIAPLRELSNVARQYDAVLIVDEAHGTGVMADDGTGACAHWGVKADVPIRIGTLSKAIGSQGGFVVGPQIVIETLINRCRPLIYSTAAAPVSVAAALAGLDAIRSDGGAAGRRSRVRMLARRVRKQLLMPPGSEFDDSVPDIPIVPVVVGQNARAIQVSTLLKQAGFFIPAIRPPTVPDGTARLRISLSSDHSDDEVTAMVASVRMAIEQTQ